MIKAQYNILGFYDSVGKRTWNRQDDTGVIKELFRVFIQTNKIPAVALIVDAATSATLYLLDSNDNEVGSALTMTVEEVTGGKALIYTGTTLSGNADGDYSLKIVNGSETYYSDIFGWTSNSEYLADLLKVSAVSSNIRLGTGYILNLTGFTFECYLNYEYVGIAPEFQDEIAEKHGAVNVTWGTLIPKHEFKIDGNEYIHRFLMGLRILESNGTVTISTNNNTFTAKDITAEKDEDVVNDIAYFIKLLFVDNNEIISVVNQ